jgi:hypothetical protein
MLALITYCDFKFRAVYWWIFPVFFSALVAICLEQYSAKDIMANWLINSAYIMIVILSAVLVVKGIKKKPFSKLIGLGDILFLLCVAVFFVPLSFVFFVIASSIFALFFSFISRYTKNSFGPSIPLAGLQSVFFGLSLPFANYIQDDILLLLPF